MKRIILILILTRLSLIQFGQIIADHTAVDKYDKIPQQYIDKVKKMLVDIAGESHSSGYIIGTNLLELLDSRFQSDGYGWMDIVPDYTDLNLRIGKHTTVGEQQFFTTQSAINIYKTAITAQNNTGNPYSVMGFGWCYDMTYLESAALLGPRDPFYNVRWYGNSEGGADGPRPWGIDRGDSILTGNRVSLSTYLNAVEQYIQHCKNNGYPTKIIFTTGPVDNGSGSGPTAGTETGCQREIKHDYIRSYVNADNSRILFDYADILCWNNSGVKYVTYWNDGGTLRPHVNIHPDNMMDYDASWNIIPHTEDGDHIGEVGALRIAKAMWWMLARIAGWNGVITDVKKNESPIPISVVVDNNSDEIRINNVDAYLSGQASLYNLYGVLIESKTIADNYCTLNKSNLLPGIYVILVNKSNRKEARKIVVLQ